MTPPRGPNADNVKEAIRLLKEGEESLKYADEEQDVEKAKYWVEYARTKALLATVYASLPRNVR